MSVGAPVARAEEPTAFAVKPSRADPRVTHFDDPNVVIVGGGRTARLVIFLPGTGGKPQNLTPLLKLLAGQGYNVIGLSYNDTPAVNEVCPQSRDIACSAKFRETRVFGTGQSAVVTNSAPESIESRLVTLLRALAQSQPDRGWDLYLDGQTPRWDRIVVSGMSQGAGMAAFIAKRHVVRRVVLFSSPWDVAGPNHDPAPWLSDSSATPPDRWFAEYHRRELTTKLISRAYAALKIPTDHIWIFDRDLPPQLERGHSPNPYHVSTIINQDYAPQWRAMFGQASELPAP